jgi:GNAT superfamily N-acetyltransferase
MPGISSTPIDIRPLAPEDAAFLRRVVRRMHPGPTASPRDPAAMEHYFATLEHSDRSLDPGAEGFIAELAGSPAGVMTMHQDADYFTGHPRAHVDHLVVALEMEGRGVGRALLEFAERWGRARGCHEVVLDVFATNTGALAFYESCGYRPDHVRMAKPLT